ncbi:hypothetical protein D9756_009688 [Leucocoprinus leucothites]|uniref:RING-type domain-containing protein n=1 Tax=Leucocoprinus leucothites TaxID=201217 RepID=A0A8H5FSY1_9AGAR|nr:hypothetical protein D9756_009688 [Leucoagaricus leucothites]
MPRIRPNLPPLNIPHENRVEQWLDRFDDPDSIDEHPEYTLNLGAESPASNLSIDDRIPTPPPRVFRRSRSNSTGKVPRKPREAVDRDCGICFEYAVHPSRTFCCGMIFCFEHITDWLHGPSSDGRCPSCSAPCSADNILSLASPTLIPKTSAAQSKLTPHPLSQDTGLYTTSPTSLTFGTPRHRSQSTSTSTTVASKQSRTSATTTTTSTVDSIDSSILGLSPAPEESPYEADDDANTYDMTRHLRHSQSSSSLVDWLRSPSSPAPSQQYVSSYPFINPGSSTVEVISRLASVMGLTLLFYALLAS